MRPGWRSGTGCESDDGESDRNVSEKPQKEGNEGKVNGEGRRGQMRADDRGDTRFTPFL